MSRTVLAFVAAALLAACGAEQDFASDGLAPEADAIRLGTGYRYDCSRGSGAATENIAFAITNRANDLTLVWEFDDGRTRIARYSFDPGYTSSGATSYARFNRASGEASPDFVLPFSSM